MSVIQSLKINEAGPLQDMDIEFKDVNLIIGNNEEGKTTLTDILIHELFRSHKKNSLLKSFFNKRFDFKDNVTLSLSKDAVDLSPYASLLVIREGENQWGGKSGLDVEDASFWNQEIRSVIYGNDAVYAKIQKEIVSLLGVSRANTWLNQFYSNLQEFAQIVYQENQALSNMLSDKDKLFEYQKELQGINDSLEGMTQSREQDILLRKRKLIEDYFDIMGQVEDLVREKKSLETKGLDQKIKVWQDIQSEKQELNRQIAQQDSELSFLERGDSDRFKQEQELNKELVGNQIRLENAGQEKDALIREKEKLMEGRSAKSVSRKRKTSTGWLILLILVLFGGLSGVTLGVLDSLSLIQFSPEINRILQPGFYILGAVMLFVFILMLTLNVINQARALSQGEKDADRLIGELDLKIELAQGKWHLLEETCLALIKREQDLKARDSQGVRKNLQKEKERLTGALNKLKDRERDWLAINQSYENLIREKNSLNTLREQSFGLEKELAELKAQVEHSFSTDNRERLHLESKELDKLLQEGEGNEEYSEQDYQQYTTRKETLINTIQDITSSWTEVKARILSRISQARLVLTKGVNQDKVEAFYQDFLSWDLRDDPYNITGLVSKTKDLLLRLEQDIIYSETIYQAVKNRDSRLESLIGSVLQSEIFQDLWSAITLGKYTAVYYEIDKKVKIFVEHKDGNRYPFSSLSTGTRNQFYLILRMSLASFQLTEPGILILDDAFISFDSERRKAAVNILKDMSLQGWQIVYSSVNEQAMAQTFTEVFDKSLNVIVL